MATRKDIGGGIYQWFGKDGKAYATREAAEAADKAWDATMKGGTRTAKMGTSSGGGSTGISQLTSDFLSKWGDISDSAIEMLQNVISGGGSTGDSDYDDLINSIKTQVSDFETNYAPAMKESTELALENIRASRGAVDTLKGLATADYAGVAGRAATDAKAQSEIQSQEAAKELMSYGVDPTSGKFGALSRKNALGTARNVVEAMNKARQAEKSRVGEAATQLAGAANTAASTSTNLASNLMSQKSNLLGMQTGAYTAKTAAEKAKADTAIAVANALGAIGEGYGSMGATMLGLQIGSGEDIPSGDTGGTTSGGTAPPPTSPYGSWLSSKT